MRTSHSLVRALTLLLLACGTAASGPTPPPGPTDLRSREARRAVEAGRFLAINLPGPSFFPEGVAAAPDGTLYVGSVGTGAIVRAPPHALGTESFVEGRAAFGVYGLDVDQAHGTLWACTWDDALAPAQPSQLSAYDLATGARKAAYPMPGELAWCNDVAVDGAGNVYATDSLGNAIVRLPVGGSALETWATDDAFSAPPWTVTLNGIAWDGAGALWVVKYDTGDLFSVPILADGRAGAPIAIPVAPALTTPDGIEVIDAETLLVVENETGQVVTVELSGGAGVKKVIASGFMEPATAAIREGGAWVAENQGRYWGTGELPDLPFRVYRVPLP